MMRRDIGASAEGGSFGFARASALGRQRPAARQTCLAQSAGSVPPGIDSVGAPGGDKDGYSNFSGRLRGTFAISPAVRIGASAIMLTGMSQFDGYDPVTFEHTDTLDNSRNHLAAGRVWAELGNETSSWSGSLSASLLDSSNRNYPGR